jgi:hypothetical protein
LTNQFRWNVHWVEIIWQKIQFVGSPKKDANQPNREYCVETYDKLFWQA